MNHREFWPLPLSRQEVLLIGARNMIVFKLKRAAKSARESDFEALDFLANAFPHQACAAFGDDKLSSGELRKATDNMNDWVSVRGERILEMLRGSQPAKRRRRD